MRSGLYHEAKSRTCLQKRQDGINRYSPYVIENIDSRNAEHDINRLREANQNGFPYSASNLSSARPGEIKRMINGCFPADPR